MTSETDTIHMVEIEIQRRLQQQPRQQRHLLLQPLLQLLLPLLQQLQHLDLQDEEMGMVEMVMEETVIGVETEIEGEKKI